MHLGNLFPAHAPPPSPPSTVGYIGASAPEAHLGGQGYGEHVVRRL